LSGIVARPRDATCDDKKRGSGGAPRPEKGYKRRHSLPRPGDI
jgi:hypothetical protein